MERSEEYIEELEKRLTETEGMLQDALEEADWWREEFSKVLNEVKRKSRMSTITADGDISEFTLSKLDIIIGEVAFSSGKRFGDRLQSGHINKVDALYK
jgi:hypothetical protein